MRSRSAGAIDRARVARLASLSPDARVQIAAGLGEAGLRQYMDAHGVDRPTAVARIKATRRLGRRASASAQADEQ
jgi:hypothetical protein